MNNCIVNRRLLSAPEECYIVYNRYLIYGTGMDILKNIFLSLLYALSILLFTTPAGAADELYIITARDGSTIVASDYWFTDEYVEFKTDKGLPGYIKRTEFVKIENMVGVPQRDVEQARNDVNQEERIRSIWFPGAGALVVFCAVLFVYLRNRRNKSVSENRDNVYGRIDKEPTTQGLLSFEYKGSMGKMSKWTIEVRRAYEEDGILYVEGICTTTDKRKKFRADRIVGPVTDVSRDHQAPMEHFFVDKKEEV